MWARTCCGNPDAIKILFTSSPTKWKEKSDWISYIICMI